MSRLSSTTCSAALQSKEDSPPVFRCQLYFIPLLSLRSTDSFQHDHVSTCDPACVDVGVLLGGAPCCSFHFAARLHLVVVVLRPSSSVDTDLDGTEIVCQCAVWLAQSSHRRRRQGPVVETQPAGRQALSTRPRHPASGQRGRRGRGRAVAQGGHRTAHLPRHAGHHPGGSQGARCHAAVHDESVWKSSLSDTCVWLGVGESGGRSKRGTLAAAGYAMYHKAQKLADYWALSSTSPIC